MTQTVFLGISVGDLKLSALISLGNRMTIAMGEKRGSSKAELTVESLDDMDLFEMQWRNLRLGDGLILRSTEVGVICTCCPFNNGDVTWCPTG